MAQLGLLDKETQGASTRQVGDVITSIVRVRANQFTVDMNPFSGDDQADAPDNDVVTAADFSAWTVESGVAYWDPDPSGNGFRGIHFEGGAKISRLFDIGTALGFPGQPASAVLVDGQFFNHTEGDWVVEFRDGGPGGTLLASPTTSPTFFLDEVGPAPSGVIYVSVQRLAPSTPPPNSDASWPFFRMFGSSIEEDINVVDNVPAAPVGTTRTWTAVEFGTVTPAPPASGVGDINHTFTAASNYGVDYTIMDTVTSVGTYQNSVSATGPEVVQPALAGNSTGQAVQINAVAVPPTAPPARPTLSQEDFMKLSQRERDNVLRCSTKALCERIAALESNED